MSRDIFKTLMKLVKQLLLIAPIYTLGFLNTKVQGAGNVIIDNYVYTKPIVMQKYSFRLPQKNEIQINFNSLKTAGNNIYVAFQPKIHHKPITGAPNKACIYFTIKYNKKGQTDVTQGVSYNTRLGEKVDPNTQINVYFPLDGKQPTTRDAATWSCANEDPYKEDSPVTNWYMTMFGVSNMHNGGTLRVGFGKNNVPRKLITGKLSLNMIAFENAFKTLAANPVGRVLLYRILIEIRRIQNGNGTVEDGIQINDYDKAQRNLMRGVTIVSPAPNDEGFKFSQLNKSIQFDQNDTKNYVLREQSNHILSTKAIYDDPIDVGLFHEMLHWYHYLRNTTRTKLSDVDEYKYTLRSYYGNIEDAYKLWDNSTKINDEEIRTILGTPDYARPAHYDLISHEAFLALAGSGRIRVKGKNNRYVTRRAKFLNGDDLSENVYRITKGLQMRFSHSNKEMEELFVGPNGVQGAQSNIPDRIKLAHKVATDCYTEIHNRPPRNWELKAGQAFLQE